MPTVKRLLFREMEQMLVAARRLALDTVARGDVHGGTEMVVKTGGDCEVSWGAAWDESMGRGGEVVCEAALVAVRSAGDATL